MKQRLIILTLLLALCLTACGGGTTPTVPATEPPPTTEPASTPASLYDQARLALDNADHLSLRIRSTQTTTLGQEQFTLESDQQLRLSGLAGGDLTAQLEEKLTCNGLGDSFDEYYADGTLYTTIYDDYHYQGSLDQDAYLARFAPAALLDPELYGTITATVQLGETHLTFADPAAGEAWAMPQEADLISAEGNATFSPSGALVQCSYTITYRIGGISVTHTTDSAATVPDAPEITVPGEDITYLEVDSIDALRPYEIATLYLTNAPSGSSRTIETIVCQAAGVVLAQQTDLSYAGTGSDHLSQLRHTITISDQAETETLIQTERFQDGSYTFTDDGQEASEEISADMMLNHCQDNMAANAISLDYLSNASAREVGGFLYLDLAFNEDFARDSVAYLNNRIFSDPNFLDAFSNGYTTVNAAGYLAIDLATGLPTAIGQSYSGVHTVDGQVYPLAVQTDQSVILADPTVTQKVTGDSRSEPVPENPATPLFYHVTGGEGQELWLLGTIHVGDSRTAYLPQPIYDALDASDALAVEFDIQAFEEALSTDTALAGQVSAAYFYSDGTTVKSLLDETLYNDALALMKASGNYNASADLMKPYLWSQSITNFYVQQGYALFSEYGMDNRLLTLAREKGMEIRDIESGLFQVQMSTSFSDPLQIQLLEDSLSTSTAAAARELSELYEAWCAGDEETLRRLLAETFNDEGLTAEEAAALEPLVEEYNKALSYDRNIGMLEAAREYLESGDVVFYAVGLAHLLDETNGLVKTLREAGYTVELVAYP